jgi:hypothetical protein
VQRGSGANGDVGIGFYLGVVEPDARPGTPASSVVVFYAQQGDKYQARLSWARQLLARILFEPPIV